MIQAIKERINKTKLLLEKSMDLSEKVKILGVFEKVEFLFKNLEQLIQKTEDKKTITKELIENKMFEQAGKILSEDDVIKEKECMQKAAAEAELNNDLIKALKLYKSLEDKEQCEYVFSKIKEASNDMDSLANAYLILDKQDEYKKLLPDLAKNAENGSRYLDALYFYYELDNKDKIKEIFPKAEKLALLNNNYGALIDIYDKLGKDKISSIWEKYIEQVVSDGDYIKAASLRIVIKDWSGLEGNIVLLIKLDEWPAIYQIFYELPLDKRRDLFLPIIDRLKVIFPIDKLLNILGSLKEDKLKEEFINEWLEKFETTDNLSKKQMYSAIQLLGGDKFSIEQEERLLNVFKLMPIKALVSISEVNAALDVFSNFYQKIIDYFINQITELVSK